jgi:spore maturation protein CgeB
MKPHIAFFGSSLVSAYWNGAATYYRGIVRALAEMGYRVTFYEPDAFDRQAHRDMDNPSWAEIVVYSGTSADDCLRMLERARASDVIVKASGVGVFDELLEAAVPTYARPTAQAIFWDVDAPATLARVAANPEDAWSRQISRYDWILTYGGGPPVIEKYLSLGARRCVPIYNALDPTTHFQFRADDRFRSTLSLLANRLPDRELRVEQFFLKPASALPRAQFVLGGSGWGDKALPPNVRYVGHVYTHDHNVFNASAGMVLNVARDSMVATGYCPATRIFEAAGAAACIVTDAWQGLEAFLEPGREILVAWNEGDVIEHVDRYDEQKARKIGANARRRILAEHTYAHRARQLDALLTGSTSRQRIEPRQRPAQPTAPTEVQRREASIR